MTTTPKTAVDLTIERRFDAAPERVFDAWTNPDMLKSWWRGGAEGWATPVAEVDLRVGGAYRLTMTDPEGNDHTVYGEFREINPPSRLSYTWSSTTAPTEIHPDHPTLVVIDFEPDGDGTLVRLAHTGFDTEHQRDAHARGWDGCLANLERALG